MHRILDVKPEHESIIVDRVEAYVIRALSQDFPHVNAIPSISSNQFAFSNEESTLITDSSSHSDEIISSNPEKKLDPVSEIVSETVSEEGSSTRQPNPNITDEPQTDVKVEPLKKKASTPSSRPSQKDESFKDLADQHKRRTLDKTNEEQKIPVLKTFLPRKLKSLQGQSLVTAILLLLVVLAVCILIYLLFA
ncbi:MAG: hypothetical protein AB8G05_04075 [Oligoflexales bacterium]